MHHSLIDPAKLHDFGESRRHQKMRKSVIKGCAIFGGTSMSFLPITCDAARGLQCPKETCKRCIQNRFTSFKPTRTHVDRTWSIFRTFGGGKTIWRRREHSGNSYLKIRKMMTRILLRKWLSFERWKSFESWGCVINPLGRTNPRIFLIFFGFESTQLANRVQPTRTQMEVQ